MVGVIELCKLLATDVIVSCLVVVLILGYAEAGRAGGLHNGQYLLDVLLQ